VNADSKKIVLDVQGLSVVLKSGAKTATLVDNVSFSVREGECLGILGESGSGKSVCWKAFMRLLDTSGGQFEVTGRALFDGLDQAGQSGQLGQQGQKNLLSMSQAGIRRIRGSRICVILQNPMTCFDPLYRIGYQMGEGMKEQIKEQMKEQIGLPRREVRRKCIETLELMRIRDPEEVLEKYPHQLSGGMLQRVMIGLALAAEPDLIIADEPTTALDVLTQFEIVEEFRKIKNIKNIRNMRRTAMIFISHDIGVVSKLADQVIVMRNGSVRERGAACDVIGNPRDPYTQFLIEKKKAVMDRFAAVTSRGHGPGDRDKKNSGEGF
jgi:nickel transport system ATP-binding protein